MKILNKFLFAVIMSFIILPFVSMVIWSFFSSWGAGEVLPRDFTLRGFEYFIRSGDWLTAAKSVVFSTVSAFITLVLSIMLSRFFIKCNYKYKEQLESMFYLPMLLPVVSICIGSHKMMSGLFSDYGSLIVLILHIYFSLPYAFKMVYSCYTVWGIEQEHIARGLGAGKWKSFCLINVPVYLKGYISSFIMAFIVSYSQYFVNFFVGNYDSVNFSMIMTPYITGSDRNISSVYTLMYILYGIIVMAFCSVIEKTFKNNKEKN